MYVFEIWVVWLVKMLIFGLKWFLFVFLSIHIFWPKCCVTVVTSSQSAFYPVKTLLWDVLGIVYTHVRVGTALSGAERWRWESENAGKPVIMNLHVLTVAHYCRLFTTKCIFIYVWIAAVSLEDCLAEIFIHAGREKCFWNIVVGAAQQRASQN